MELRADEEERIVETDCRQGDFIIHGVWSAEFRMNGSVKGMMDFPAQRRTCLSTHGGRVLTNHVQVRILAKSRCLPQ
jgi:hypothetical protein